MPTQTIRIKSGMTIFYRSAGNPDARPLVLLHGWPSSSRLWHRIIPALARQFYVLAPDLPGHGMSDPAPDQVYDLNLLRTFVLDFFDALGLTRASLAAHDLGGMAGLSFAARHQDRLDRFIIMDTSPFDRWHWMFSLSICLLRQPILTRLFLCPPVFRQILATGFHDPGRIDTALLSRFRTPWTRSQETRLAFSKTIAVPQRLMTEPVSALARIQVPSLILWAENDRYFSLGTAQKLHAIMKNSKLKAIKDAGHFLQEEQPDQIADAMLDFLGM